MLAADIRSTLETLISDLGRGTVSRALQTLVRDLPTQLAELRMKATAGDPVEFKRLAHNLKGRCGMLGLESFRKTVYLLEQSSQDSTPNRRLALLDELDASAKELVPDLSIFLKELTAHAD